MKKIVVCDLDGTLLDEQNNVIPGTKELIQSFIDDCGIFIIATGRLDHDIVYVEEYLGIKSDYRISQNGAVIKDSNNNLILKNEIDSEVSKQIFKELDNNGDLRIEVSDLNRRYFPSERLDGGGAEFVDSSVIDPELFKKIGNEIIPIIFLIFGDIHIFKGINETINEKFSNHVDSIMTSKNTLEILNKGVSKGKALDEIMKMHHIRSKNIFAIGDAENDISLFQFANYSYVMEHASEYVKKQAKIIKPNVKECMEEILSI